MSVRMNPHPEDDALAAEYVLRLLPSVREAELLRRVETDATFASKVAFWQSHFSALDWEVDDVAAPAGTLPRIERRLFGTEKRLHWWDSLAVWRGLAGIGLACAVVAMGLNVALPGRGDPQAGGQLVATLEQEGSGVRFVALYDNASGIVRLTSLSGDAIADRDYELWAIQGSDAPVSMGVVPVGAPVQVPVPQISGSFGPGTVLAITLEPRGGSPSGAPTGPVVASGAAIAI